ncbi:hypothetical protein IE077_003511, partial [Cardiosporidium cionae]
IVSTWGAYTILFVTLLHDDYTINLSNPAYLPGLTASLEALVALTFVYGILPLVIVDVILPSRTKHSWWLHLAFILFYCTAIITKGILYSKYVPFAFV